MLLGIALAAQRVPALGLELEFLVVAGDEDVAELWTSDVANEADILQVLYLLVASYMARRSYTSIFSTSRRTELLVFLRFDYSHQLKP